MADPTHQPTAPPADTPPPGQSAATILPRGEETPPAGPEQIAQEAQEKLTKMSGFWNRVNPEKEGEKKEEPAKVEEKPAKPAAKTKVESKPEDTPDPEKKPAKRQKKEQEVDPIQLAEATGREIGREMARAQAAKDAPPAKPPEAPPELPEEFRRDAAVFEEMARLDPKKYNGIRQTLSRYTAEENKYIAKWEAENEGETFDGDDPVHNDFYKKVRPDFDEKDFEQAKESLIEERAVKRAEERVEERIRQRESESENRRERTAKIKPEVETEMFGLIAEMVNETAPEHSELAKDWASIQKLDEENPLLADTIVEAHNQTKPLIEATMRLFRNIDHYDEKNPLHQQIGQLVTEAETAVLKMPVKDRYDDHGRLFATQAEYSKMDRTEREGRWYIAENELSALVRVRAIGRVKQTYEREKEKLNRYTKGGKAGASATNGATSAPKSKPEDTRNSDTRRPDTSSPSISGRSTLPGDGQGGAKPPANGKDLFFNRILGA